MNSSLLFNILKRNMPKDLSYSQEVRFFFFFKLLGPRDEKFPLVQIIHQIKIFMQKLMLQDTE